jgi:hypothetical protein
LLPRPRTNLKAHPLAIPKSVSDEHDDDFAFEHRRDPCRLAGAKSSAVCAPIASRSTLYADHFALIVSR